MRMFALIVLISNLKLLLVMFAKILSINKNNTKSIY